MKIIYHGGYEEPNKAYNPNQQLVYYWTKCIDYVASEVRDLKPTTKGTTMQRFFILERTPEAPFEFRVTVAEAKDRAEVDAEFKVTEKFVLEDVFTDSEEMLSLLDRYLQLADGSS